MAVTMADIQHLRKMTGAGMMDCKNALTEADNDFEKAMEIIRKKGQAVAAKRSDRDASEGCVMAKNKDGFAAMIALKCETDFVAKNADFVELTNNIIDAALAAGCKTLDEVKALPLGKGTVQDADSVVEGPTTAVYIHPGNRLATIVAFNKAGVPAEVTHEIAMQIAAMAPVAVDEAGVPAELIAREKEIAADKAREEGKPENLIERIAQGRISKFYKEVCLLNQEYVKDPKKTVADYLKSVDKELTVLSFGRFTLNQE